MAVVEPHMIAELAILYAIAPWLARQTQFAGALLVAALTILVSIAIHTLVARELPQPPLALLRHVAFALLIYGVLLGYFGLRAKALSPAIAESRLQALQARIRPHFLFNSINAVLSLVRTDPKQAETALLDMADLFRVLMRDNRQLVPLTEEIELCRQYLALEKLRLTDRLQVEWHLNSMPGDALVPPLVLQPLLENAVYHGIEPSSTPGVVSINVFYRGGEVHAILRNPYQRRRWTAPRGQQDGARQHSRTIEAPLRCRGRARVARARRRLRSPYPDAVPFDGGGAESRGGRRGPGRARTGESHRGGAAHRRRRADARQWLPGGIAWLTRHCAC